MVCWMALTLAMVTAPSEAQARVPNEDGIPEVSEQSTAMPTVLVPTSVQPLPDPQGELTKFKPDYPYAPPTATAPAARVAPVKTLAEAIALAYRYSPRLLAQRASLRGVDQRYPQARASYQPSLEISGSVGYTYDRNEGLLGTETKRQGWASGTSAVATQSLYSFGRNRSAENTALAQVRFEREVLRSVETEVMLAAVSDYVDVIRDAGQVTIATSNKAILEREFNDDSARYAVREITIADLEQVRSRMEAAAAGLLEAKAQLAMSQARFLHDVGAPPGELSEPDLLQLRVGTLADALAEGEASSPLVRQAQNREKISRAQQQSAEADRMPRIDARGTASVGTVEPYSNQYRTRRLQGEFVITMPVLDGGLRAARVAEARENNQADWLLIEEAVRESRDRITQAWNGHAGARASLVHYFGAVDAARKAFEGARIQERAGDRTTVQVLDFARDLLVQQTNYNTALANEYLYRANLLAAMGRLEAPLLLPSVIPYDSTAHFRRLGGRTGVPLVPSVLSTLDGILIDGIDKDRPLADPAISVLPVPSLP